MFVHRTRQLWLNFQLAANICDDVHVGIWMCVTCRLKFQRKIKVIKDLAHAKDINSEVYNFLATAGGLEGDQARRPGAGPLPVLLRVAGAERPPVPVQPRLPEADRLGQSSSS